MITKESLISILGDRPVAYHPMLAKKLGGVEVAIFVSQLLYWTGRSKLPGGWIFKTQAEFEEETGLTRRNQETARRKLKEIGVLDEALRGVPATMHYRLNLDTLAAILSDTRQSSMAEPAKLDCTDQPNLHGGIVQTPESIIEYNKEVGPLSKKLLSMCLVDYENMTHRQKEHFNQVMKHLNKNKATIDTLENFELFWQDNWRGKKGSNPTLLQIIELWPEFNKWFEDANTIIRDGKTVLRIFG